MTTTYCAEWASKTILKKNRTETLKSGAGWYVVKHVDNSRTGGKQAMEYLHGPWSEDAAARKARELNAERDAAANRKRVAKHRAAGQQISVTLTDADAIAKLATLRKTHKTVKAAIEHALRTAK